MCEIDLKTRSRDITEPSVDLLIFAITANVDSKGVCDMIKRYYGLTPLD